MNITVFDIDYIGKDIDISPISSLGNTKVFPTTSSDELSYRLKDTEVAVLNKIKLTKEVLKNAPALKLICVAATGYDNIDTAYCRKNGIAVANVPGYSTHSVAAVTVATVLNLLTHLKEYSDFVADGDYTASGAPNKLSPAFHDLYGKTWGIIGYGNIGKKVADVARAFGCKVIYSKNTPADDESCVDIDTLCKNSDIITLHCPLNDSTRGLIDSRRLNLMKKSVILVNSARGAVCDESAVAEWVKNGNFGGFGCDVYSAEPFTESHPFYGIKDMPSVCLTPHIAWASFEARTKVVYEMAENIKAFLNGEKRNRVE
ncbi:MAG: hydroxyacid dehydrogenase [Clostridia bacterium]|nr:hydroxyacid dehydrogenase [Clostridia bacterium]